MRAILESNLPSKAVALVAEALHAARQVSKNPTTARGGPWSSPRKLTTEQLNNVRQVSKLRSTSSLFELATNDRRSSLHKHLSDLSFSGEHSPEATAYKGGYVRMSNRSGTRGNACRKDRVRRGVYVQGDKDHKRSHRGVDQQARRVAEYKNRKLREDAS